MNHRLLFFLISEGKEEYDVTGRATYLQACRDSGVIPVSYFHRNLQQADIDIKHHGLGPMGAKAIAIALVVGLPCNHVKDRSRHNIFSLFTSHLA